MVTAVEPPSERRQAPADCIQLVIFRLAGERYAVEVRWVREIILPPDEVTILPQSPKYLKGLFNLRNEVLPLVDLGACLGLTENPRNDDARVILVEINEKTLGFLVGAVEAVSRVQRTRIGRPGIGLTSKREYITGLVQMDEDLVILLAPEKLPLEELFIADEGQPTAKPTQGIETL